MPSSSTITLTSAKNQDVSSVDGAGIAGILIGSCFVFVSILAAVKRKRRGEPETIEKASKGLKQKKSQYFAQFESFEDILDKDDGVGSFSIDPIEQPSTTFLADFRITKDPDDDRFITIVGEEGNVVPQFNPNVVPEFSGMCK